MTRPGYPRWSFPPELVDQQLAELDKQDLHLADFEPRSLGPFSVFHVQGHHRTHAEGEDVSQWSTSIYSPVQHAPEASTPDNYLEKYGLFDEILDLLPNNENNDEGPGQSKLTTPDRRHFLQSSELQERLSQPSSPSVFLGLTTSVYQNTLASQLMDIYVHRTADLLQPITHAQNTYNSIYVPRAMLGFARFVNGYPETSSNVQATNEAIFFSLLATLAFHLRGTDEDGRLDSIARNLRAKAFTNLQRACRNYPCPVNWQSTGMISNDEKDNGR